MADSPGSVRLVGLKSVRSSDGADLILVRLSYKVHDSGVGS
jgi:hypothetical protein